MNAGKLMTYCASSALTTRGRTQLRYCDGFESGIEEVMRLYKVTFTTESIVAVCVPAGTSSHALSQAFVQHATSKGVDLDQPAAAVVLEALRHKFAC